MFNGLEPNTKILAGKLKENHLEKISQAYQEMGLGICGKSITEHITTNQVNEWNSKLREFEITPQPFGEIDNKLYIGVKATRDGKNIYVHTRIDSNENFVKNPEELREKYDLLIRSYQLE